MNTLIVPRLPVMCKKAPKNRDQENTSERLKSILKNLGSKFKRDTCMFPAAVIANEISQISGGMQEVVIQYAHMDFSF